MVTHVFCADHSQREFLERVCRIPARKLSVVLNLPNEEIFGPVKKSRPSDRFELVYHGTIARRLGIDIMLSAVAKVPTGVPVHFSVFGAGDFLGEAEETARQLQLENRVRFSRSFFPVEMIPEMVGNMDLGVIGNRRTLACDKFMLPVKLLEYVYLGIPVVVPRLEVIGRYFDDDMVKYYEPENADELARCIVDLYECPEERQRLVRNASKFYEKYNWRRQAEAYLGLLSSVAGL
jgi:glycosyltransferase involved in cell wall biosynthesis